MGKSSQENPSCQSLSDLRPTHAIIVNRSADAPGRHTETSSPLTKDQLEAGDNFMEVALNKWDLGDGSWLGWNAESVVLSITEYGEAYEAVKNVGNQKEMRATLEEAVENLDYDWDSVVADIDEQLDDETASSYEEALRDVEEAVKRCKISLAES